MKKANFNTNIPILEEAKRNVLDKMYNNQTIKDFINNNQIPEKIVLENLGHFVTFLENDEKCDDCKSFKDCTRGIKGFDSVLIYNAQHGTINLEFHHCEKYRKYLDIKNKYLYYEYDESLFELDLLKELNNTDERKILIKRFGDILTKNSSKGIYVFGKSGVGKSYLLAVFSILFVDKIESVAFIKTSTLVSILRSFLDFRKTNEGEENSFISELEKFKKVDLLILDDWGGEKITEWVRDEILFPLLDYRSMNKNLVTCFTSNYSLKDYKKLHSDEIKSARIISRITSIADEFELTGLNRL